VRRRATLVGDSTKGGANDVDYFKLDDQFEMYLSTGRGVNPVTHTNWEGIGVVPDVLVPAASALDTAIALARSAAGQFGKVKEARLTKAVDDMQVHLERAETLYKDGNPHRAKAALDSVFRIGKDFGLVTEFFINVLAYNYSTGNNERMLIAVLSKNIEFFPTSPSAHESLAYGYSSIGKRELALKYYRKALELDPDNRSYLKAVRKLQRKGNAGE